MRTLTSLYSSLAIVAIGALAGCNDRSPTNPTLPTLPTVSGIQVVGPDSIAAGQSAQFVANVRQADGTAKTATGMPNLRWRSSNISAMTVSASGLVTVTAFARDGEAVITAEFTDQPSVRGTREVVIQPEGTYRIVGSVRDAELSNVGISGAKIEVLQGSQVAVTDFNGQFRLYGVPRDATVRITAEGYEAMEEPVNIDANVTRDFALSLSGPRLSLNGAYTLSLDFASPCSMDSALQHRTYDAELTSTGNTISVNLTGPQFRLDSTGKGNRFAGRILGNAASFTLDWYGWPDFTYPNLVEKLADGTFLIVQGDAYASITPSGLKGTFYGDLAHYDAGFPTNTNVFPNSGYLSDCYGDDISFKLTPRSGPPPRRR